MTVLKRLCSAHSKKVVNIYFAKDAVTLGVSFEHLRKSMKLLLYVRCCHENEGRVAHLWESSIQDEKRERERRTEAEQHLHTVAQAFCANTRLPPRNALRPSRL